MATRSVAALDPQFPPPVDDTPVIGEPVVSGNRLFWINVPHFSLPSWWRRGATRECLLIGRYAFKLPSWASWEELAQGHAEQQA